MGSLINDFTAMYVMPYMKAGYYFIIRNILQYGETEDELCVSRTLVSNHNQFSSYVFSCTQVYIFVDFRFFLAIDELMTPEEKAKLFTAIGYSDSSHHLSLPKQVNES